MKGMRCDENVVYNIFEKIVLQKGPMVFDRRIFHPRFVHTYAQYILNIRRTSLSTDLLLQNVKEQRETSEYPILV